MDWLGEIDKWDKRLHSEGVPDAEIGRRLQAMFNAYADADKSVRNAQARRAELSAFAEKCKHDGTTVASREAGITPRAGRKKKQTFYREKSELVRASAGSASG